MAGSLNSAELTEYQEQGILFPLPVMSATEAAGYLDAANQLEEALGGNCKPVELSQMHLYYQWAHELITHPGILGTLDWEWWSQLLKVRVGSMGRGPLGLPTPV